MCRGVKINESDGNFLSPSFMYCMLISAIRKCLFTPVSYYTI